MRGTSEGYDKEERRRVGRGGEMGGDGGNGWSTFHSTQPGDLRGAATNVGALTISDGLEPEKNSRAKGV